MCFVRCESTFSFRQFGQIGIRGRRLWRSHSRTSSVDFPLAQASAARGSQVVPPSAAASSSQDRFSKSGVGRPARGGVCSACFFWPAVPVASVSRSTPHPPPARRRPPAAREFAGRTRSGPLCIRAGHQAKCVLGETLTADRKAYGRYSFGRHLAQVSPGAWDFRERDGTQSWNSVQSRRRCQLHPRLLQTVFTKGVQGGSVAVCKPCHRFQLLPTRMLFRPGRRAGCRTVWCEPPATAMALWV